MAPGYGLQNVAQIRRPRRPLRSPLIPRAAWLERYPLMQRGVVVELGERDAGRLRVIDCAFAIHSQSGCRKCHGDAVVATKESSSAARNFCSRNGSVAEPSALTPSIRSLQAMVAMRSVYTVGRRVFPGERRWRSLIGRRVLARSMAGSSHFSTVLLLNGRASLRETSPIAPDAEALARGWTHPCRRENRATMSASIKPHR